MKKKKITNANPSPATRFKKGQSGNPRGVKKGLVQRKELKEWTRATVAEAYKKYMNMEAAELRHAAESLELPILEVILARALLRDRTEGTMDNTEIILDRAIGRVPNHQMLTGGDGVPLVPPTIIFEAVGTASTEGMGST